MFFFFFEKKKLMVEKFKTGDGRGFGVRAVCDIPKRSVVLEYVGELLSNEEAVDAEVEYEQRGDVCCYLFWVRGKAGEKLCLDATNSHHISKFINHSKKRANLLPTLHYDDQESKEDFPAAKSNGRPRIMFKAIRNIVAGEELLFDYGEHRQEVLEANPWLRE